MAETKAHKTASSGKATKTAKTDKKTTKTTKPVQKTTATKTAKTTKVTAAASKPTTTATTSKSQPVKKGGFAKVVLWIISLLALAAVVTAIVVCVINKNTNSVYVETSKGEKIETAYVGFNDDKFRIKIPTSYKAMEEKEIKEKYGSEAPNAVYTNDNDTINIAVSTTDNALANDQIEEYLKAMKSILGLGGDLLGDDYYQVGDHNVATIQLDTKSNEGNYYNNMMFFSVDGKLAIVTFNCTSDLKDEYIPVGDFVIKSLAF